MGEWTSYWRLIMPPCTKCYKNLLLCWKIVLFHRYIAARTEKTQPSSFNLYHFYNIISRVYFVFSQINGSLLCTEITKIHFFRECKNHFKIACFTLSWVFCTVISSAFTSLHCSLLLLLSLFFRYFEIFTFHVIIIL